MVLALLPSEIARLILNYLIDQGLKNTSKTFLDECKYLAECKEFIERGILLPKTIHGKTLKDFLIINNTDLEGFTSQSVTTQTDFEVSPKLPRHPQPLSYFLKPPGLLSSRRDSSQSSASGDSSFSLHNNNENAANSTTNTNEANKTEKNVDIIDLSKSTDNDETENVNNQQNNSAVIQLERQVYKSEGDTESEKQPDVDQPLKDDSNTKRKPILIGKNVEKLPQFSVSVLERQLDSIINDPDNYITTPNNSDPLPTESLSITSSQNQQVTIAPLVQTQQLPTNNQTITTVLTSAPTSMQRSGDPLILIPVPSLNQTMIQQPNNGIISLTPANISSVSSQPFVINESQFTTTAATPVGAFILPPAVATTPKLISTNVASNTINGVSIVATKTTTPMEVNNQNKESPKPDNAIKPQTTYRKIESMKIIMGNKQQGKENETTAKVSNEEKSNTKEVQNSSSSSILASILAVSAENTEKEATPETQTSKKETTPRVSVYELAKRRGNRLTPTIKVIFDKGAEEALAKRDAKKPLGAHNYRSPASHASSEANKLNDSFDENEENLAENEQPAVEKYVSKLNAEEAASILDEFLANPEVTADSDTEAAKSQETEEKQQLPVVKKRGRPRKYPLVENKATKIGDISCPIDVENIEASFDEHKDAHTKPKRLRSKTGFGDRSGWF